MNPTLCPPLHGLRLILAGAWYRYRCGRRFGHFPAWDSFGYEVCARCGSPVL